MPPVSFKPSASWRPRKVVIQWEPGPKKKVLDGKLYGKIAIHPGEGVNKFARPFVVTSATVGLAVTAVDTEIDAMRIGEVLWNEGCLGFRLKDPEAIKKNLPKWIGYWCIECRKQGKYLDPKPFQEEHR